jgi:hypothetical protein
VDGGALAEQVAQLPAFIEEPLTIFEQHLVHGVLGRQVLDALYVVQEKPDEFLDRHILIAVVDEGEVQAGELAAIEAASEVFDPSPDVDVVIACHGHDGAIPGMGTCATRIGMAAVVDWRPDGW